MDRTERVYRIDRLLQERTVVPVSVFLDELEVSLATFKRDLEYLRDRLNAPIVWDRDAGGYRFDKPGVGDKYELPGLWFSASEIHALLTMLHLLKDLGPGLLTLHVEPLLARLKALLDTKDVPVEDFERRIRIQRVNARACAPEHFLPVISAVLQRKRLIIEHYSRLRDETASREVSPQRLSHYQENWYLDTWCHLRNQIRRFSLDSLRAVTLTEMAALEVPDEELQAALDSGYGIFSGKEIEWAELVFTSTRARWVSQEMWHPAQKCWYDTEGNFHLQVPYTNPIELSMDILRHIPEVKVLSPPGLRQVIAERLQKAVEENA